MRRAFVLFPLLIACGGGLKSPFLRVTDQSGRIYYADMRIALHSDAGRFLTFRDLVTKEQVRLEDGSYEAQMCPRQEVAIRQQEYLLDQNAVPRAPDR